MIHNKEKNAAECYFHDLYLAFLRKVSLLSIQGASDSDAEKMKAMLDELIKVRAQFIR